MPRYTQQAACAYAAYHTEPTEVRKSCDLMMMIRPETRLTQQLQPAGAETNLADQPVYFMYCSSNQPEPVNVNTWIGCSDIPSS